MNSKELLIFCWFGGHFLVVNGNMDKANNLNMQNVLHRSQLLGLDIGNDMLTRSQTVREVEATKLWDINESIHDVRHQSLQAQNLNGASLSRGHLVLLDTNCSFGHITLTYAYEYDILSLIQSYIMCK